MSWIVLIIVGAIIGLLGKFVAPGDKDNTPIWMTVILGIVGTLIGGAIWEAVSTQDNTSGIDWWRWIIAIVVSAVLVMIASTVMGRNTTSRNRT